ncbi:MAG TPA: MFS transporter [Nocardioides sp.]
MTATTTPASPAAPPTALGARFRLFLVSATAANLGDGLMAVALMWLASSLTREPAAIALIGLANRLPWLLLSLPAGVIVDRVDRRRLIVAMDGVRCATVLVLGLVVAAVQSDLPSPAALAAGADTPAGAPALLGLLALSALVLGCAEVLRDNAAQTLLPALVERHQLEKANARLWSAEISANQFVGPPLGGVLVGLAVALPFLLNAGLLALSAVLLLGMSGVYRARPAPPTAAPVTAAPAAARPSWRADLAEGITWLWRHRLLRTLALMLGVMNLMGAAAFATIVLFVQEVLGVLDGWAFGLVLTGSAIGSVLAGLVSERIVRRLSPGPTLLLAVAGMGLGLGAAGLTSSPVLFWTIELATGLTVVLWNVVTVSLRQRIIPDHLLGRVNAAYRFFGWGMMALGAPLGALVILLVEPTLGRGTALRAPYLLGAAAYLVMVPVVLLRLRTTHLRAAEEAAEEVADVA